MGKKTYKAEQIIGKLREAEVLLSQLWNCSDVLPGQYCEMLDLVPGSTYAMAVRKMATSDY